MRRTQMYLEDDLWSALHARARAEKTTVSELVRNAIRERYLGKTGTTRSGNASGGRHPQTPRERTQRR